MVVINDKKHFEFGGYQVSNEAFNIFSVIGIGLTFLASIAAVVVSIISLKCSNKVAKRSGYLSTITASRDKWSNSLRESSSLYFTQIARLCSGPVYPHQCQPGQHAYSGADRHTMAAWRRYGHSHGHPESIPGRYTVRRDHRG